MKKQLTTLMIVLGLATAAIAQDKMKNGIARGSVESNDSRVIHSTTPFSPWQRLS